MSKGLSIIGAGLAGLLAANMLRHREPVVFEKQKELPNNHSAVLRFRTPVIGDVIGIPFRKVTMIKAIVPYLNPVADALNYSWKTNGNYRSDRSIITGLAAADRYIAPPDLIARLAEGCGIIRLDSEVHKLKERNHTHDPVISTIPMPVLATLLEYEWPLSVKSFDYEIGVNVKCDIKDCDAYASLLIPDPKDRISRISITGSELIAEIRIESADGGLDGREVMEQAEMYCWQAMSHLGITGDRKYTGIENVRASLQQYAKIAPIDDDARKEFIYTATDKFNIYSLGRYATWRPGLLLDDLVKDIRLIDGWISKRDRYAVAKHRS